MAGVVNQNKVVRPLVRQNPGYGVAHGLQAAVDDFVDAIECTDRRISQDLSQRADVVGWRQQTRQPLVCKAAVADKQRIFAPLWHDWLIDVRAAEAYIDAHYAADGRAYGLGGTFVRGPAAFKEFRAAMVARFPDIRFSVDELLTAGDRVAVRFTGRMTYDGTPVELQAGAFVVMRDGQIVEARNLVNFVELLEQVGALPAESFGTFLTRGAIDPGGA